MMKKYRHLVVCLVLSCLVISLKEAAAQTPPEGMSNITEIMIPEFQSAAISKEGAVLDTLIAGDALWLITNKVLWKWNFLDRKVQKISLLQKSEADVLVSLGFDGLNLYVAFTSGVYQFAIKQAKVFKYPFPNGAVLKKAHFFGHGDSFWMIANDQLNKIDRYGKTIAPTATLPAGSTATAAAFDPEHGQFWYVVKNKLYRLNTSGDGSPAKILQLKQPVRSLVAKNGGAIVTTTKTVLITSADGKRLQTIPVEKSRQIVAASNSEDQHAYVFNDQILESFDLKTQRIGRYILPFDSDAKIKGLKLGSGLVHMVADGKVRLFAFSPVPGGTK